MAWRFCFSPACGSFVSIRFYNYTRRELDRLSFTTCTKFLWSSTYYIVPKRRSGWMGQNEESDRACSVIAKVYSSSFINLMCAAVIYGLCLVKYLAWFQCGDQSD
jgi:hypothetical protein